MSGLFAIGVGPDCPASSLKYNFGPRSESKLTQGSDSKEEL